MLCSPAGARGGWSRFGGQGGPRRLRVVTPSLGLCLGAEGVRMPWMMPRMMPRTKPGMAPGRQVCPHCSDHTPAGNRTYFSWRRSCLLHPRQVQRVLLLLENTPGAGSQGEMRERQPRHELS